MRSIVYHQLRMELHIIKAERFVYHHCESVSCYTPKGVMRYNNGVTVVDDIQPDG